MVTFCKVKASDGHAVFTSDCRTHETANRAIPPLPDFALCLLYYYKSRSALLVDDQSLWMAQSSDNVLHSHSDWPSSATKSTSNLNLLHGVCEVAKVRLERTSLGLLVDFILTGVNIWSVKSESLYLGARSIDERAASSSAWLPCTILRRVARVTVWDEASLARSLVSIDLELWQVSGWVTHLSILVLWSAVGFRAIEFAIGHREIGWGAGWVDAVRRSLLNSLARGRARILTAQRQEVRSHRFRLGDGR